MARPPLRLVVALLLTPAAAAAQRADSARNLGDLDIEQLAKIRVTSVTRGPGTVGRSMAAVFVISQEDIRRAGVTSLPEALRLAPGLQVVRLGAQNWSVTSRGFADFTTNKMLVLIDGRPIYSPLFAGVFWDAQLLPVDEIERIEVILGPGATLWGSNAVNGVINVITQQATATRGGLVAARAGSNEHLNAAGRYGFRLGARGALRVYGGYLDREPLDSADGTSGVDGWHSGQGGVRMDLDASARDRITVLGDAYDATSQAVERVALPQPPFAQSTLAPIELSGMDALARWNRAFSDRSSLLVQAYFDRSVRREFPTVGRIDVNIASIEVKHRIGIGRRHDVVWGAGYRLVDGELAGTFTTALSPPQRTTHLATAYAQDEITLVPDRWAAAVGTKLERNSYTGLEVQPSLRLRWTPRPAQTWWAAASRAVRSPSSLDEDVRFTAGGLATTPPTLIQIQGNPAFQSEELIETELGFRSDLSAGFSVDASVYYGWYDRLRTLTPEAPRLVGGQPIVPIVITNASDGHSAGGTAAVSWRVRRGLRLRGSYTYLRVGAALDPDAPTGTTLNLNPGFSPRHQAAFDGYVELPARLEASVTTRYVSALHTPDVPAYAEASARLGWSVTPAVSVAVVGEDLLHRRHTEFAGGTYVPRRGSVHVTWRF